GCFTEGGIVTDLIPICETHLAPFRRDLTLPCHRWAERPVAACRPVPMRVVSGECDECGGSGKVVESGQPWFDCDGCAGSGRRLLALLAEDDGELRVGQGDWYAMVPLGEEQSHD
ncbi:MAG: hypothetical protein Q8Q52_05430, partial [Acidimicrobiia bacterium]|nr:hypothetical protein [Acidimicrobiia bacterium]